MARRRIFSKLAPRVVAFFAAAIICLLVAGVVKMTRDRPICTIRLTGNLSLKLVAILSNKTPEVMLVPWQTKMFDKLPASFASIIKPYVQLPEPKKLNAKLDPGELQFVFFLDQRSSYTPPKPFSIQQIVESVMLEKGMRHIRLRYDDGTFSESSSLTRPWDYGTAVDYPVTYKAELRGILPDAAKVEMQLVDSFETERASVIESFNLRNPLYKN